MSFVRRHHFLIVLAFLALLELLTFGQIVGKIGFYLDDWNLVRQLHFGPQDLIPMITTYIQGDPKIMPRPVEGLHFMAMFLAFGMKPIGYHILNGIMEVVTAWLSYVVIHRLCNNRTLALIAATIFLLYPIHDSTHYWIVASSCTLSLMCFMASMWCQIEGVARPAQAPRLLGLAYFLFAISIFNYECYLPLFPVSIAAALYVTPKKDMWRQALVQSIPYVISIGAVLAYGRFIVPLLGQGWMHATHIDPVAVAATVIRGAQVSVSPEPFAFIFDRLFKDEAWAKATSWAAIATAVAAAGTLLHAFSQDKIEPRRLAHMAFFGIVIVLLSYTIFGLNKEYEPTLLTFVNRVNYAAALGAGLLFAAFICSLPKAKAAAPVMLAAFIAFSMLGNWALARPWTLSWMMQKHVQDVIASNKSAIKSGDNVILLNSPRYIMWAPVFDGTWDFQNALRLTLDDATVNGGVVSERMTVGKSSVIDTSHNFLCGNYPFANMHALVATQSLLLPVPDAPTFIDTVSTRGMGFDLDKTLPSKWRTQVQLAASGKRGL